MRKRSMDELGRLDAETFKKTEKTRLALVLDNVRSGLNVGSAFRTADAFALEHLYLCGITARPPHREILKTALGSTDTVDWSYYEVTGDLVQELRRQGFAVYAVEQAEGSIPLQAFRPPVDRSLALIFGNEVHGVEEEVMTVVDGAIEVPQFGTKHSLNISVCVGIVVWEVFRQLRL